ncbi:MAG: outer membrane protein assembly factor BamA [Candidatus Eisenbacteria bacterium]|nr:outer membrane protein assembly factor BamA [Candidatus Eisenbacteria bacterium]
MTRRTEERQRRTRATNRRGARRQPASLLVVCVLLALAAVRGDAEPVTEIRVEGAARIGDTSVIRTFGVRPDDPYDPEMVAEGIRNLYSTRQYEQIRVSRDETVAGVVLTIHLVERPLLGSIRYEGNEKIKSRDLAEESLLQKGLVLTPRGLFQEGKRIREKYAEKGYRNADVEWEDAGSDSLGRRNLLFRVGEGEKVRVKRIVFHGVKNLEEKKLRKGMKTKPDSWIRSGEFKPEEFEEDKGRILQEYGRRGYLDAVVESTDVSPGANPRDLTVTIWVDEGKRYDAGEVSFDGNVRFGDATLGELVRLRPGSVFDQNDYDETVANLYNLYTEEGYIFANIVPERSARGDTIDLVFHIVEGNPARIGRVEISGNQRTKERTIRRELVVAPGDLFKRSRIIRSQRELMQLGFFQDIRFDYRPVRGTDEIDLSFDVLERPTGEAQAGVGISSAYGATGFIRLGQVNLFGGGERANLMWEFGEYRQLELSYTEPWLFDTPTTAGFDVTMIRRNWDSYYENRRGGGIRLGRRLPWLDYSRADWQYRLEEREIEPRDNASAIILDAAGTKTLSSTRLSFTRNSTDRLFHPTRGTVAVVAGEWAGGPIGGDVEYQQYELENRWYFPSFWKFFLGLRARVGVVDGLENPSTVPIYKRYRLGGTGLWGLRGYEDRDVVPEGNAFDVGGRTMLILSAEYKFPLVEQQIFGLFFFDAGNTWNSFREVRPNELRRGAGLGVRFEIPMLGQLGFDMGYGLDKEDGGGWEPHFQLGNQF